MAIDREKIVRNLAFGEGDPLYIWGWVTYETRLKQFGLDQLSVPFDLDRAKELMAEAGYPDGFEMEATLTGGASNVVTQAAATMWEEIGIRSTFTNIPYPAFRPQHVKRLSRGAWGSAGAPSSIEPLERAGILQNSDNSINFGYEHPVFQGLMEEAFTLVDTEERWAKERWSKEQGILERHRLGSRSFGTRIRERFGDSVSSNGKRYFLGIGLKANQ